MSTRFSIIGGGVAGLALANLFQQKGLSFHLYDKEPAPPTRGHGFLLQSEGVSWLSSLLNKPVANLPGQPVHVYSCYDHSGNLQIRHAMEPSLGISRAELIRCLSEHIAPEQLSFGKSLSSLQRSSNGVEHLTFEDGASITPEFLIAADGIGSKVRESLFPQSRLLNLPQLEIVCTLQHPEVEKLPDHQLTKYHHAEGGRALGLLKTAADTLIWYAQIDTLRFSSPDPSANGIQTYMQRWFSGWCEQVSTILTHSNFSNAHIWRIRELVNLPAYHSGNTALLGDAAHPLIPLTSQGVLSAFKDAYFLNEILNIEVSPVAAFNKYTSRRMREMDHHHQNGKVMLENFNRPLCQQNLEVPLSFCGVVSALSSVA